jgi:hypothetical protein
VNEKIHNLERELTSIKEIVKPSIKYQSNIDLPLLYYNIDSEVQSVTILNTLILMSEKLKKSKN